MRCCKGPNSMKRVAQFCYRCMSWQAETQSILFIPLTSNLVGIQLIQLKVYSSFFAVGVNAWGGYLLCRCHGLVKGLKTRNLIGHGVILFRRYMSQAPLPVWERASAPVVERIEVGPHQCQRGVWCPSGQFRCSVAGMHRNKSDEVHVTVSLLWRHFVGSISQGSKPQGTKARYSLPIFQPYNPPF